MRRFNLMVVSIAFVAAHQTREAKGAMVLLYDMMPK